ncbi:MAG: cyclohexanone monooxygenase [Thiotrichales bacterium]|nr:cyclohexanone monooxygenase [Thiotrichales bacterium]
MLDVVIVGAGFGGLYALHRVRGLGLRAKVLEASDGVGGTWHWNRYPGARCDVESLEYSYSFSNELEQEWHWTERYAAQPEILAYANHVADRFDLRRDIIFETRVSAAHFDDERICWTLTSEGDEVYEARFCVMALGCLSLPTTPDFRGLSEFEGAWYHTGWWPHGEVDLSNLDVGVIGTGSSGVQAIPVIAEQAGTLTVFQRTANFSVPLRNGPMDESLEAAWKANNSVLREQAKKTSSGILNMDSDLVAAELETDAQLDQIESRWLQGGLSMWNTFADMLTDETSNQLVADYVREQIRATVTDPRVAEALCPSSHPIGSKRLCADTRYYETYNRNSVVLVDVRHEPIERITTKGIRTSSHEYPLDVIVFATGFDAMTGPLTNLDIRGLGGISLGDHWEAGPRTYLGLTVAGFPNLFSIAGAGSPSVLCNMILAIEQHVDWIADCLAYMREHAHTTINASASAEQQWVTHSNEVADATLYTKAASWYMGANIPGKARVFMPYVGGAATYRRTCDEVAEQGYRGFVLS